MQQHSLAEKSRGNSAQHMCERRQPSSRPWLCSLEFVRENNATMWKWHDPVSDEEILVLYHKAQRDSLNKIPLRSEFNTYAGFTRRDNTIVTSSGIALAAFIAADNTGPPLSRLEVNDIFRTVRELFPNATKVFGSTWDQFVADIDETESDFHIALTSET